MLGDNIFYGHDLTELLRSADGARPRRDGLRLSRAAIPSGTAWSSFDADGHGALASRRSPQAPKSNYAVTGLYFYDADVVDLARSLKPSARGELEITDLNRLYLERGDAAASSCMGRGYAWLDTGTHDSLLEAGQFVATIEKRQGLKIACPEEIAWRKGWITTAELEALAVPLAKSGYGRYLSDLARETGA